MLALIVVRPVAPMPAFLIEPVLLTALVLSVIVPVVPKLSMMTLPVPVMPPVKDGVPVVPCLLRITS